MSEPGSAKCQSCGGIFLKTELSADGRCKECVAAGKKPTRRQSG